eukprot:5867316-Alexandrium_andersonii.AAC.1
MSSLGPAGPPRTQGSTPLGNSSARARGKAPECFGGPSPRCAALESTPVLPQGHLSTGAVLDVAELCSGQDKSGWP